MMNMKRLALATGILLTLGLVTVGCSDSSNSNDTDAGDSGAKEDTNSDTGGGGNDDNVELSGTWALRAQYEIALLGKEGGAAGMCPKDQTDKAVLLLALDFQPGTEPGKATVSAIACDLTLPSVKAMAGNCIDSPQNTLDIQLKTPESLTKAFALSPAVTGGVVMNDNALTFDQLGFQWGSTASTLPTWNGEKAECGDSKNVRGTTKECDTECVSDCTQVKDDDGDGYPAVSVHLCGTTETDRTSQVPCNAENPSDPGVTMQGAVRMVLRTAVTMKGEAASSNAVSGTFSSDTNYSLVGSTTYLSGTLITPTSVHKSLPEFQGVEQNSKWRMIRVDGLHGSANWQLPDDPQQRCEIIRSKVNEFQ